ncbi:FAD-binding monooxygenase [Sinorhizobium medicae]|uniref:FAD-dependent monooxygenase n=1 Tax=Sinorhizobium medicae TaxID=110321 RepID=UPI000FDC5E22|nr:FAD-dependent monooxygenase [Sinorhizobium medicae]RVQ42880.1 FAD-binding monooxygenase [Sinorhizobium medicae]
MRGKDILISGSGIAGLVLAWWLGRYGFRPTIVEKSTGLRRGGHAVDLWGTALDVLEWMGLLAELEERRTRKDRGVMITPGLRPREIELNRISGQFASKQIEIMRGELVGILGRSLSAGGDFMFGNSISGMDEHAGGVNVTFESGDSRDFELVIGADGQHSNVRHIAFGEEDRFSRNLGGYVCGYTVADDHKLGEGVHRYVVPNKTVVVFPIRHSGDAAVIFLFRPTRPLGLQHDDVKGQIKALQTTFGGESWEVAHLLDRLTGAKDFYFESLDQITMQSWHRARIALVGDAAYCPAPAVGGGTSLAVIGAYTLARELAEAKGDYRRALQSYHNATRDLVHQSRVIGPALFESLVPSSRISIYLGMLLLPLVTRLPGALRRNVPLLPRRAVRAMRAVSEAPVRHGGLPESHESLSI